ncbi:MAG: 50S ribosomal protein L25/general stress protein Ctc [Gammaproteobacteria bacterium]|nr:50S ribosomal protein L25/general stress protein Ctc [Gammaproteobacteria bacterium]MCW8983692.1 50S ribosomal protein L25/general stress protein Ctc [Gammaproteobacteria bacterium]
MSVDFNITAESRSDMGKGASRRLRREDKVPAVIYGAGKDAVSVTLDHNSLFHHLEHEAFYSHILNIAVDGKAEKVVLKDLQRHPYKPTILHADFLRVDAKEKLRMNVPLHFTGEEVAPGVKIDGGLITHNVTEVEISCLPSNLPEYLEVDLSGLQMDHSLHLSDIKLPEGVEIIALTHGADHDLPVAAIHKMRGSSSDDEGEVVAPAAADEEGATEE